MPPWKRNANVAGTADVGKFFKFTPRRNNPIKNARKGMRTRPKKVKETSWGGRFSGTRKMWFISALGGVAKWKSNKNDSRSTEKVCAYASGKFNTIQSTIDAEINACINTLEKLKIFYLDKEEVTLRTDCQAIISFYNKTNSNKASRVRWAKFTDALTGTGVKINVEHIDGKDNVLADSLSRLVNVCLADECIENQQLRKLDQAAMKIVQETLEFPIICHENTKTISEQIMKISNHYQKSSQDLLSAWMNQELCTNHIKSKQPDPSKCVTHTQQLPKNSKWQQPQKQSSPLEIYRQLSSTKPKSVLENQQEITIGPIKRKKCGSKTKKLVRSSSNWNPWPKDWDEITYNTGPTHLAHLCPKETVLEETVSNDESSKEAEESNSRGGPATFD